MLYIFPLDLIFLTVNRMFFNCFLNLVKDSRFQIACITLGLEYNSICDASIDLLLFEFDMASNLING